MKIIVNTLKAGIETWDDPGDYPSGAGSWPLPSYDYVAEISGHLIVQVDKKDLIDLIYSDSAIEAEINAEVLALEDCSGLKNIEFGIDELSFEIIEHQVQFKLLVTSFDTD
jgi:hypothetical protein